MTRALTGDADTGVAPWPSPSDLDVAALREAGWAPTPIREYVVKIASRCNLNCDYCYVYEHADQSWRGQPKVMSLETVDRLAERIREHALAWGLSRVGISFHGGEPLLAGAEFIDTAASRIRGALGDVCAVNFMSQTNATLITAALADVLARHDFRVGVSLDGDRQANDRHRLYRNGRSSFDDVLTGISVLRTAGPRVFAGVLATIDLANDPLAVYRTLQSLDQPHCDLLLPHGNWTTPPPGLEVRPAGGDAGTPYADWLLTIFNEWYGQERQPMRIRIFDDILHLVLGGRGTFEMFGIEPITLVSIETDGSIELVDTLKTAYEGAPATSLHLESASLDDVLAHPGVVARQIGRNALHEDCLACPVGEICGGGMYTHRYRHPDGFKNPSVYCRDLLALITAISERVLADVRQVTRPSTR